MASHGSQTHLIHSQFIHTQQYRIQYFERYISTNLETAFREMVQMINSATIQRGGKLLPVEMLKKGLTLHMYLRTDPKTTPIEASLFQTQLFRL